ncbi:unnamed protein product [Meloidogyne enterolobii]|uniref:Uncharacterized protein n=1 Tax=Meloidogyne enterolobii TaxID=390850 RepID=A0ACB0YH03_MELEN
MLTNSVNFLFKRSFAISASALQVIRPPVQVSGIEGKYASALYSSGMKEKSLDKIEKDLSQLKVLYDTNNDFKLFVENPILNKQKKADAIQAVLKNQGMSKTVQNFFGLIFICNNGLTLRMAWFSARCFLEFYKLYIFRPVPKLGSGNNHEPLNSETLRRNKLIFVAKNSNLHNFDFSLLLTESGRLVKLSSIINSFETIMRAHRNELQVEVTSAEPLNKKQEQSLRTALASFANAGQELNISFGVKPSLIGGMVVTIDDKYVDLSMASKIKKMEALLEKSI